MFTESKSMSVQPSNQVLLHESLASDDDCALSAGDKRPLDGKI